MKKPGKRFQNVGLNNYNPINDIIEEYLHSKEAKSTVIVRDKFKKTIMTHLKSLQDYIVGIDGLVLPHQLGKLQVMSYKSHRSFIDWKTTNDLAGLDNRTKGPRKLVYYSNNHSDGLSYKLYYRTYYNATKNIRYAMYANRDLWTLDPSRLLSTKIKETVKTKNLQYAPLIDHRNFIPLNKRNDKQRVDW